MQIGACRQRHTGIRPVIQTNRCKSARVDRGSKQMGPASLPTPLSPTRGLLFWRTFRGALGARCLTSERVGGYCHRRSRRHPVPQSSGLHPFWPKPFRVVPAFLRFRDRSSFAASGITWTDLRLAPSFLPSTFCRMSGLSGRIAIAFFSSNLTCFRPEPSACPVSKTAWTVSTASVVLKNLSEISSLEPDFVGGFSPFRCPETAPEE